MNTKRILIAGLLGGIAMFFWTAIAHMILPLGESGVQELPNEAALLATLHSTLGDSGGLYLFPGMGHTPDASKNYAQKLAANPSGILMYNPPGMQVLAPRQFIAEFLKEFIESLLAVFLLAQTRLATYSSRVGFVALVGLLVALGTNVSYWNWYGFPFSYTIAYIGTELIGFLWVGLIAPAIVKP